MMSTEHEYMTVLCYVSILSMVRHSKASRYLHIIVYNIQEVVI